MRAAVPGLLNPHPLAHGLPGVFQDDTFTSRFVSSFDEMLAPVVATLDNIAAYLDPELCPEDFLPWLAGWVALELDDNWSVEQQRRLIGTAVELARWHGTRRGVVELVSRYVGMPLDTVEIVDSGGVTWSATSEGAVSGAPTGRASYGVTTAGRSGKAAVESREPPPERAATEQDAPRLAVRVRVADRGGVDMTRLRRLVALAIPAHVACEVDVVDS